MEQTLKITEKMCGHCKKLLPSNAFGKNNKTKTGLRSECKLCRQSTFKEIYYSNIEESRKQKREAARKYVLTEEGKQSRRKRNLWKKENKKLVSHQNKIKTKQIKLECVEYKGGKCNICNYNKSLQALHFHHLDPKLKDFNISSMVRAHYEFERIKLELDKCILLCANCHAEEHDRLSKETN